MRPHRSPRLTGRSNARGCPGRDQRNLLSIRLTKRSACDTPVERPGPFRGVVRVRSRSVNSRSYWRTATLHLPGSASCPLSNDLSSASRRTASSTQPSPFRPAHSPSPIAMSRRRCLRQVSPPCQWAILATSWVHQAWRDRRVEHRRGDRSSLISDRHRITDRVLKAPRTSFDTRWVVRQHEERVSETAGKLGHEPAVDNSSVHPQHLAWADPYRGNAAKLIAKIDHPC